MHIKECPDGLLDRTVNARSPGRGVDLHVFDSSDVRTDPDRKA
jgi:hypothetical protein